MRPEYVKCIEHERVDKRKLSWCGRKIHSFEWRFTDIGHAAYSLMNEDRLVPCPECVSAIVAVLQGKQGIGVRKSSE